MKIAWITKERGSDGKSGDAVFDSKLVAYLRRHVSVEVIELKRHPNPYRLFRSLFLAEEPPDRTRYRSEINVAALRRVRWSQFDRAVVSHESLDWAVVHIPVPVATVSHNVTSTLPLRLHIPAFWEAHLARRYANYERHAWRMPKWTFFLSSADAIAAKAIGRSVEPRVVYPGMPSDHCEVGSIKGIVREVAISGTYEWRLKRHDLRLLAREYGRGTPIFDLVLDDAVGPTVRRLFPSARTGVSKNNFGFGLITDRFSAGFKLKVGSYIASGRIVLTFADLIADYAGLPFAEEFIRPVSSIDDINNEINRFEQQSLGALKERFLTFQQAAACRFDWNVAALEVLRVLRN